MPDKDEDDLYPRRYCLGLIEAEPNPSCPSLAARVSEALLPRPH